MKKFSLFLLSIISPLLLTGCFGGGDENDDGSSASSKLRVYETNTFSIDVPFDWEIITAKDFTSEIPANTLAAFRNNIKNSEFTANITVLHNSLPSPVSSVDYAKGLLQKHVLGIVNFSEIEREEVDVGAGETAYPSLLVTFQGKENDDASVKEFVQISVVKGEQAYIATGAYLLNESEEVKEKVKDSVRSFRAK